MIAEFEERDTFSFNELFDFWHLNDGTSNRATGHWRIHNLKKQGVLQEIKMGWYTLRIKPVYAPSLDKKMLAIDKLIHQHYRNPSYCVWNLDWLNEFSVHQFRIDQPIVEIEKELLESLRMLVQSHHFLDLSWSIGQKDQRLPGLKNTLYVLPLPSRAPLTKVPGKPNDTKIPALEKILVDIFDNTQLFSFLQGSELERVFSHAIEHYAINYSTLFAYAHRRYKDIAMTDFLNSHFPDLPSILFK